MTWRISVLLILLPLVWGCSTTYWKRTDVVVKETRIVAEVEQWTFEGEPKDAGFSHPASVAPEVLSAFFNRLKYENPRFLQSASQEPVVLPENVEDLSLALADGLKRCGPAQRMRFRVRNAHLKLGLIPTGKKTRGVVFVKPAGTLNVALDIVDDEADPESRDNIYYRDWGDPTRRTLSTYVLILPEGARLHRSPEGRTHELWIVVPLE